MTRRPRLWLRRPIPIVMQVVLLLVMLPLLLLLLLLLLRLLLLPPLLGLWERGRTPCSAWHPVARRAFLERTRSIMHERRPDVHLSPLQCHVPSVSAYLNAWRTASLWTSRRGGLRSSRNSSLIYGGRS